LAHALQDYQTLESYNRGDWHMMGIVVKTNAPKCSLCGHQKELQDSLWGIESDAGSYAEEVISDLVNELLGKIERG